MNFTLYISFGFFGILGLALFYFSKENKKLASKHSESINTLQTDINCNKKQIAIRNNGLNKYQFLKHNLDEALVLQPKISVH